MKLEVERGGRHKIYANSVWKLEEGNTLIQEIPVIKKIDDDKFQYIKINEPTFRAGDNIRIDGTEYYVTRFTHYTYHEGKNRMKGYEGYEYDIVEGRYVPSKWQLVGDIKNEVS